MLKSALYGGSISLINDLGLNHPSSHFEMKTHKRLEVRTLSFKEAKGIRVVFGTMRGLCLMTDIFLCDVAGKR